MAILNYPPAAAHLPTPTPTPTWSSDEDSDHTSSSNPEPISVSTSFYPGSHSQPHNIVFKTSDSVLFYLNIPAMQRLSHTAFNSLIPPNTTTSSSEEDQAIDVPESSAVFDVLAHALYDISCAAHTHPLEVILSAIDRMSLYSITPTHLIFPGSHLYQLLLNHASTSPLQIYALAGQHGIHELAVHSSQYSMLYPISAMTDDLACRTGAVYLKKLLVLHTFRHDTFKRIISRPLELHPSSSDCDPHERAELEYAWVVATTGLFSRKGSVAGTSSSQVREALSPPADKTSCPKCKASLKNQVEGIIFQWMGAKRTI
ncbi:hypothetical protein CC2G_011487 [Coprinopsis cinerea AmutBmut pab1-1]|nr:hypothetical protein CC2G_011487 [Coprinopsis cinerea AmutBmut pab1-1]